MKKVWKKLGTLCLLLGLFFAMSLTGNAAADDIAGGVIDEEYGQITWRIDKNGHLTVEGWGDLSDPGKFVRNIPWKKYRERVYSAEIEVKKMKNASYLFRDCINLKEIDLSKFDTSMTTQMGGMFYGCQNLLEVDVTTFHTEKVEDMAYMFYGCESLITLDVSSFNTRNVSSMIGMFQGCEHLQILDLSNFDTSKVTSMCLMFSNCISLRKLDLSEFETSNVENMDMMFAYCESLIFLNVNDFETKNTEGMYGMFMHCHRLKYLDLSSFEISGSTYVGTMLQDCWELERLVTPKFLREDQYVILPKKYKHDVWYRSDGETITHMSANDAGNMTLVRIEGQGFRDINENDWYISYVEYVSEKGLMKGYNHWFKPNDSMTRAMVVQTLYNIEGKPVVTDFKACKELKDVYQDWYTDAVCWAYNEGITTGYDDTKTFEVNKSVTREELAAFLYRYANYKGYGTIQEGVFSDLQNVDKITSYAKDAMSWAVGAGLISGIEIKQDGVVVAKDLAPQGTATRAQMAAILQRFCSAYNILLQNIQGNIPENAFEWNGHYYAVFDNCLNWEVAKAYCESRGGHLAIITSPEENEAVYSFIKENGYTSAYFGLSDKAEEGTWRWVTGEEAAYTNWNELEPSGGADENYAMFFYLYEDGTWNDGAFSENVHDGGNAYICEWM